MFNKKKVQNNEPTQKITENFLSNKKKSLSKLNISKRNTILYLLTSISLYIN